MDPTARWLVVDKLRPAPKLKTATIRPPLAPLHQLPTRSPFTLLTSLHHQYHHQHYSTYVITSTHTQPLFATSLYINSAFHRLCRIFLMSDPLSITAGVLALTLFAFNSSTGLYQLVDSFRSNQRTVRELREELEALNDVLRSLQETVASTDIDLAALKLPLFRCGKACKDFEAIIIGCTAHSTGTRTSFRDWAKIKYMGDDIAGFKNMLAGYKSTISIALGNANM